MAIRAVVSVLADLAHLDACCASCDGGARRESWRVELE
jgi:hypothetical protein